VTDGKHRHPATVRLTSLVALVVALGAAGVMLAAKPPPQPSRPVAGAGPGEELTLEKAYPGKVPVTVPGKVKDGARYSPLFFLDEQRSVGTAAGPSGASRLILITPAGERELRRLPKAEAPEFAGFATQGQRLVWMELTNTADGTANTKLWTIDDDAAVPRMITADTGDVALFDRSDDVVIHDGVISWVAAARTDLPVTEIRTVPIAGGKVSVKTREGAFAIAAWPWLTSVNLGQDGPVELVNAATGKRVVVNVQANELMACSPTWCRSVIIGSTAASTVIELLKPDGSSRMRVAAGNVAASTVDVALLDRYEVYSYGNSKLTLYDLAGKRMITVAKNVSQIASRGPMLWWSTGDNETVTWHVIDLRTLGTS
jgi:hypothetical protein